MIFSQDIKLPIPIYINKCCFTPLNNWKNLKYFITLFPTLFPLGSDRYFIPNDQSKKMKMSLKT